MLGEHLSATSRDGHTTRQLMLRHGCTRAVTPPTAFLSRRCVWRLLSLIFRCSDFAFNRETIWKGWKLEGGDDVSRKLAYDEKKVFFLLGITRESGRELSKGDCSCRWLTKKLCNPSFIFPFSRAFDDCKISLSEILCRNVWEARDLKERDFEVLLTRDRETIVTNKLFVRQRRSETTYNLVLLRTNPYPRYFLWEKPASLRNARICIV